MYAQLLRDIISPRKNQIGIVLKIESNQATVATQEGTVTIPALNLSVDDRVEIKNGVGLKVGGVKSYEVYRV